MSFKDKLPGENLQVMECETESNALVIILELTIPHIVQ